MDRYPRQMTLDGVEVDPYQDLNLRQRAAIILDNYPDARDNDNVFVLRCLWEFDGLRHVIDVATYRKILAWAARQDTTSFETWRRRRQEIQRNRSGAGYLQPSEDVADYRRRRDGAGPPRGKR